MTLHYMSCTLSLVLGAASVSAGSPPTAVTAGLPPTAVTAVLMPDGPFSPMAIHEMGREAAGILKHSGVLLRWRFGPSVQVSDGLLIVVRLRGRCEMDGPSPVTKAGALGWSHQVDGAMLPFSDLACDSIRGAIQSTDLHENPVQANVLLGRAMGRVLAHELYHIVADTAEHGEDGVAQPALSGRDLTSGQLELRPSDVEAIQSGLRQSGR
jgi:hypothetical protein